VLKTIYCTWFFKTFFLVIIVVINEIAQNEDEIDIIIDNEKNDNFTHGSKLVYLPKKYFFCCYVFFWGKFNCFTSCRTQQIKVNRAIIEQRLIVEQYFSTI
jgi:hypothetical protein